MTEDLGPPDIDLAAIKRDLWPHADPAALTSIERDRLGGPEIANFADGYRMPLKSRPHAMAFDPFEVQLEDAIAEWNTAGGDTP